MLPNRLDSALSRYGEWAPTILRVTLGVIMIFHGYLKLFGGLPQTTQFFGNVGIPAAPAMAWVVALVEFVGGIALVTGILTRIAAVLISVEFVVIVALKTLPTKMSAFAGRTFAEGFSGAFELDLLILAVAVCLAIVGSGRLSLEKLILKEQRRHS